MQVEITFATAVVKRECELTWRESQSSNIFKSCMAIKGHDQDLQKNNDASICYS